LEFFYPAAINSSLKYHIYTDKLDAPEDLSSFYFGPIYRIYKVLKNEEEVLDINALGLNIGTQRRVFDFYIDASYSKFIDKEELSDIGDFAFGIGLKARFQ
jgi:hypothetical protein